MFAWVALASRSPALSVTELRVADGRGGVPQGLQEAAHRRPRDRLGGDRVPEPHRAPVRLHAHAGHLHADQPQGAAGAEAALAEGERHTRSGGGARARH